MDEGTNGVTLPEASKAFGQNFLTDTLVLNTSVTAALDLVAKPVDTVVLEVGPGTGQLTEALLRAGFNVYALEADPRMENVLRARFEDQSAFQLTMADATQIAFRDTLAHHEGDCLGVSNLPYYLTTPLITKYLTELWDAKGFIFMVQSDVVSRLRPDPSGQTTLKRRGPLMILGEAYGTVQIVRNVPRQSFSPPPRIASSLVRYLPHPSDDPRWRLWSDTAPYFAQYLEMAFTQRRRTLSNNLKMALLKRWDVDRVQKLLEGLFQTFPEQGSARGEAIAVVDHMAMAKWLSTHEEGIFNESIT